MSTNTKKKNSQIKVLVVYVATMLVCVILFGSCAIYLLDVFVKEPARKKAESLANEENNQTEDIAKEDYSSASQTILFVGANGEAINGMAIIRSLPGEGKINILPISKYTLSQSNGISGTLLSLYESGGITYLQSAVESAFGVTCDRYIKITDDGWKALVEYFGGTSSYNFAETLYYKNEETGELTSFSQGTATRTLWGDDLRRIITYPLYSDGEKTKVQVVGEVGVSVINSGFMTNCDELKSNLQNIFNTIFNNSDTDITANGFKKVKPAYEHLLDSAKTPATYRMPKGSWDQSGYFTVDSGFKSELKEYFGLE